MSSASLPSGARKSLVFAISAPPVDSARLASVFWVFARVVWMAVSKRFASSGRTGALLPPDCWSCEDWAALLNWSRPALFELVVDNPCASSEQK